MASYTADCSCDRHREQVCRSGNNVEGIYSPTIHLGAANSYFQGVQAIANILGPDSVTTDEDDLDCHGYSEISTSHCTARPVAVVTPKTTAEVSTIARICSEYKIPMGTLSIYLSIKDRG